MWVALASVILGLAEGTFLPQFATVPLAIVAFFLTERRQALVMRPAFANAAGILAFVSAGLEFFSGNIESRLLAGAHLMVYVTWIVMFQKKTITQYWFLAALALLQVAVGSVLTRDSSFGALLFIFVFLGIWTLSVFTLYRTQLAVKRRSSQSLSSQSATAKNDASSTTGSLVTVTSSTQATIQHDDQKNWVNFPFGVRSVVTTVLAMFISAFFFLIVPRKFWQSPNPDGDMGTSLFAQSTVGYSDSVRLGEMGQILESTAPAFQVRFTNALTDERIDVLEQANRLGFDEPIFRGSVLEQYENGHWSSVDTDEHARETTVRVERTSEMVRQEYYLQPFGSDVLFALPRVEDCVVLHQGQLSQDQFKKTVHNRLTDVWRNPFSSATSSITYQTVSPMQYRTSIFDPTRRQPRALGRLSFFAQQRYLRDCLQMPEKSLQRLQVEAKRIVESTDPNVPLPQTRMEVAHKLESHLRDSGEFGYTLNQSIVDSSIDPLEDFLFNRKQGHCEYYASALALMLRTVGIPSRIVTGFKGGTENRFTGNYEVQQRHAHAWVEAYIDGYWVVLDATPASARNESLNQMSGGMQSLQEFQRYLDGIWQNYVVRLNDQQQQNQLYRPIGIAASNWWRNLTSEGPRSQSTWKRALATLLTPSRWFTGEGLLTWAGLLFVVVGGYWLLRRFVGSLRQQRKTIREKRKRDPARVVEFYERFREICRHIDLTRLPAQTHKEFVTDVQYQLAQRNLDEAYPDGAELVTKLFYRVRFGDGAISDDEAAQVDGFLTNLEALVSQQPDPRNNNAAT